MLVIGCDNDNGDNGGGGDVTINILNSMPENIIRIRIYQALDPWVVKYDNEAISIPTGQTHSITISGLTFSLINTAVLTIYVWTTANEGDNPYSHIFGGGHINVEKGKPYNLQLREYYSWIGLFDN